MSMMIVKKRKEDEDAGEDEGNRGGRKAGKEEDKLLDWDRDRDDVRWPVVVEM